jgi:hypothetical protein
MPRITLPRAVVWIVIAILLVLIVSTVAYVVMPKPAEPVAAALTALG